LFQFIAHIEDLYCFNYTASNEHFDKQDGWYKYSLESEFERMGVPNQYWIQTNINQNYEVFSHLLLKKFCSVIDFKGVLNTTLITPLFN